MWTAVAADGYPGKLVDAIDPEHQLCEQSSACQEAASPFLVKNGRVFNKLLLDSVNLGAALHQCPASKMTCHLSLHDNGRIIIPVIVGIFLLYFIWIPFFGVFSDLDTARF